MPALFIKMSGPLLYEDKISLNKNAIILCDDYEDADYITGVKRAVDQFVKEKKLKFEIIEKRFAKITI